MKSITYYRRLEKGLEEWAEALEEILKILEQQEKLRKTIHFKSETCCDKIKSVLKGIKDVKEDETEDIEIEA